MDCTGHMVCAVSVPRRCSPDISYIYPLACCAVEAGCAILGFLLPQLTNDQNVERAIVGVVYERDGATPGDGDRGGAKGASYHFDRILMIAAGICGRATASNQHHCDKHSENNDGSKPLHG